MKNIEEIEKLISSSKNNDKQAFTTLIQSVQNDLYRVAQARLSNNEDINDAIQETMIISYRCIKKLEHAKYFKTWIIKILINECNKIYKKNNKQISIFNRLLEKHKQNKYATFDIDNLENKIGIEQLLYLLSYEERLCITLFYCNNFTLTEIADILNTSPNTIKSRIFRAKEKIKKTYNGGVENETAKK